MVSTVSFLPAHVCGGSAHPWLILTGASTLSDCLANSTITQHLQSAAVQPDIKWLDSLNMTFLAE